MGYRQTIAAAALFVAAGFVLASADDAFGQANTPPQPFAQVTRPAYTPQFDAQGRLVRPTGWREWPYMGTPLTPNGLNPPEAPFPEFHNVYMDPVSWEQYKRTGEFRDGMVLVKELVRVRTQPNTRASDGSSTEVSGQGYFMGEFSGLEVAMKDTRRFADQPGHWAYFTFGHVPQAQYAPVTAAMPAAACNACHAANAGRDFVFTQFYPVMRDAAPRR